MNAFNFYLKKILVVFIGNEKDFSIEHRIFNLFSFIACITSIASLAVNLALALYLPAITSVSILLIQSFLLYLSRVKHKLATAILLTGIELHLLLMLNYFINAGIIGPNMILLLAILFLMTSVVKGNQIWIWLSIHLTTIATLFITEYHFPQLITGYNNRLTQFLDSYLSYVIVVILMVTAIVYRRRSYDKQKRLIESKALALEALNIEKDKLFSIISHDLRAPVGAVKQYLHFLNDNELSAEEKGVIEKGLLKTSTEAYQLLDNLLIWTRSQMAGKKINLKKLNVAEALEFTLLQSQEIARYKQVEIVEDLADLEVIADPDMLQLVIRNLVSNAIKFTHLGGRIDVRVFRKGQQAIFEIRDNGVGISDSAKKQIFSLGITSTAGTRKEKGTGLGLALCKEYTDLQNGSIWFETEVGKGTSFFMSLPIALHI